MLKKLKERALSLQGSIVRAGIFAIAWAILPYWLFILVAIYLFFVPVTQTKSVAAPFFGLLVIGVITPVNFFSAAIIGLLFWYILLIKELYLVDRRTAYETLAFAITFLLFREFYLQLGANFAAFGTDILAFFLSILIGLFFSDFVGSFTEIPRTEGRALRRISAFAFSFIIFGFLLAGLFLPLDYFYQTSVVFVLAVAAFDLGGRYLLNGKLERLQVLGISCAAFAVLAIVLGSARWGL